MGSLFIERYTETAAYEWFACDSCQTHIAKESYSFYQSHTTTTHLLHLRHADNIVVKDVPRLEENRIVVDVECIMCSENLGIKIVGYPAGEPQGNENWLGVFILDLTNLLKFDGEDYEDATWG